MLVVNNGIRATSGVITASAIMSNGIIRVTSGVITASASSE